METEKSTIKPISLSPEVKLREHTIYLIRIDTSDVRKGKETGEICFVEDEEVARHVVESIANEQVKQLTNDSTRVYRENIIDPKPYCKRIDIHKQELGMIFDGSFQKVATIGYVPVLFATYADALIFEEGGESS